MTSFREQILASRPNSPFPLLDVHGNLTGPFGLMEKLDEVGRSLAALGEAIRYRGRLGPAEREAIIFVVSQRTGAEYEEWAHRAVVRANGCLEQADVDALCEGRLMEVRDQGARDAGRIADWILRDRAEPRPAAALDAFDSEEILEIAVTAHYYWLLATMMHLEGVGIPDVPDGG